MTSRTDREERLGYALGAIWGGPATLLGRLVRRIPPIPKDRLKAAWAARRAARRTARERAAVARRARARVQRRHALYSALHLAERAVTGAPHRIASGTVRGAGALAGDNIKTLATRYGITAGTATWGAVWAHNADALTPAAWITGTALTLAALAAGKGREKPPETKAHCAEANRDAIDFMRGIDALIGPTGIHLTAIADAFNASPVTRKTTWTSDQIRALIQRVAPDLPLTSRLHCDGKQGAGIARTDWNSWVAAHAKTPSSQAIETTTQDPLAEPAEGDTPDTQWDPATITTTLANTLSTTPNASLNHPPPPTTHYANEPIKPQLTGSKTEAIPLDIATDIAPPPTNPTTSRLRLVHDSNRPHLNTSAPNTPTTQPSPEDAILSHARDAIGDAHGAHLSDILNRAKQANDVPEFWKVTHLRQALETLGVTVERQLSVRGVNGGRGIRAEALPPAPTPRTQTSETS